VFFVFRSCGSDWFAKLNFAGAARIKRVHYSLDNQILHGSPRTSMFLREFSKSIQNSVKSLIIEQSDHCIISFAAICLFFKHLEPSLSCISSLELDFKGCTSTVFEHPVLTPDLTYLENFSLTTKCILITENFLRIQSSRLRKVTFNFDWNNQMRNRNAEQCIVDFFESHSMTIESITVSIKYHESRIIWLPSDLRSLSFPKCQTLNFKGVNIWFSPIITLVNFFLISESIQNVTLDSEIMLYVLKRGQICNARTLKVTNYNENEDPQPILDLKMLVSKFPSWQTLYLQKFDLRNCIELQNPTGVIRLEGVINMNHQKLNELLMVAKTTDIRFSG